MATELEVYKREVVQPLLERLNQMEKDHKELAERYMKLEEIKRDEDRKRTDDRYAKVDDLQTKRFKASLMATMVSGNAHLQALEESDAKTLAKVAGWILKEVGL